MKWIAIMIATLFLGSALLQWIAKEDVILEEKQQLVWIGDNRVHIDSEIHCNNILDLEDNTVGRYIRVTHENNQMHLEFTGTDWEKESKNWLNQFQEKSDG
jgi:hypothetical protein